MTNMSFEKYNLAQGNIMIAFSDKNLSVGTLTINPNQELAKHNRPVLESLHQIKGKCLLKLFEADDSIKEVSDISLIFLMKLLKQNLFTDLNTEQSDLI